jgi:hypothetical protein
MANKNTAANETEYVLLIYSNFPPSLDFLNPPCFSDSDVEEAIFRLCSTKCIGPDEIPNFIIKGCSHIFTSFLRQTFSDSFTWKFLSLCKQSDVASIFKKGNRTLVNNYRSILIVNNSSKIFRSIYILFNFEFEPHPNQYIFVKSNSMI